MIPSAPLLLISQRATNGPFLRKSSLSLLTNTSHVRCSKISTWSESLEVNRLSLTPFTSTLRRVSTPLPRPKETSSTTPTLRSHLSPLLSASSVWRSYKISCSRFCLSAPPFPWSPIWLPLKRPIVHSHGLSHLLCLLLSLSLPSLLLGKIPPRRLSSLRTSRLRRTPKR